MTLCRPFFAMNPPQLLTRFGVSVRGPPSWQMLAPRMCLLRQYCALHGFSAHLPIRSRGRDDLATKIMRTACVSRGKSSESGASPSTQPMTSFGIVVF